MEKLPDQEALIDSNIAEYTDAIGLDEDSFTYGGKRRTKRKSIRKSIRKRINEHFGKILSDPVKL